MRGIVAIGLCALSLAGCSVLPAERGNSGSSRASSRPPVSAPVSRSPSAAQCLNTLGAAGASYTPLPDRYLDRGCTNLGTVQLTALAGEGANLQLGNIGPVTCDVSQVFAGWARFGADRAARQILGSPLKRIETFGSYSCRNVAGSGRRSGHATAAAIDISGFVLEDGRRITVKSGWSGGSSAEKQFLRTVQHSACKRFDTVLGPEYNAAHEDHLHLEGVLNGSGFCR